METVLITGTSSGIGLVTAIEFARRGAKVYAGVRDLGRAGDLENAAADEGVEITIVEFDVTDENAVDGIVARVLQESGRIDVLINNAGRAVIAPVEETSPDEARQVFETNFFGALRMMQAVVPTMRRRRSGTILNISSIGASVTPGFYGIYAASKRALEAASEALQAETEPFGIRIVVVEPGNFRTNIMRRAVAATKFSPESPYWEYLDVFRSDARRFYAQVDKSAAADPGAVADVVYAAVHDPDPKFRYVVGGDAERLIEELQDVSPQDAAISTIYGRIQKGDPA